LKDQTTGLKSDRSKPNIKIVEDNSKASKFNEYTTGAFNEEEIDLQTHDMLFSNPLYDKLKKDAVQMVKKYEEKWKIQIKNAVRINK